MNIQRKHVWFFSEHVWFFFNFKTIAICIIEILYEELSFVIQISVTFVLDRIERLALSIDDGIVICDSDEHLKKI